MEQRALRAKQLDAEQKQKLEDKEEKSANLRIKLTAENQEKAERCHSYPLFLRPVLPIITIILLYYLLLFDYLLFIGDFDYVGFVQRCC